MVDVSIDFVAHYLIFLGHESILCESHLDDSRANRRRYPVGEEMTQKLFDPKLNIKDYSWKIGSLLKTVVLDTMPGYDESIRVKSTAFYNGREQGIALTLDSYNGVRPTMIIVFGEHRNTDSIHIDCWTLPSSPFNAVAVEDFTDEAYERRMWVPVSDKMFQIAADVITKLTALWVAGKIEKGSNGFRPDMFAELPVKTQKLLTI